ncbi:hypothetical protein H6P81_015637 [Aristolochia fimbriata]|uniref:Uncharacterized protein n=1 Tax=Aristolochia fimbriata TaxID=158543 RepID=A0AAV7E9V7_ARIFI|nr:hypothetical protein H6P81_015637 [Aristolochia fimbriata]
MEARSRKLQKPNLDGRKTSPRLPKRNPPPFPTGATVLWSNSAYVPEDACSSVGSNRGCNGAGPILPPLTTRKGTHFAPGMTHINEEEQRLREELAAEIEKELEREIMEGILVLVRRLSELKANQIAHGLKDLWSDYPVDCGNQDDGLGLSLKMAQKHLKPKLNQKRQSTGSGSVRKSSF